VPSAKQGVAEPQGNGGDIAGGQPPQGNGGHIVRGQPPQPNPAAQESLSNIRDYRRNLAVRGTCARFRRRGDP
jgi:hypothetical protein